MHFCVHIQNDVEFPTKQLARYMQKPGKKHMKAADRVISYLYHTREHCKKLLIARNRWWMKLWRWSILTGQVVRARKAPEAVPWSLSSWEMVQRWFRSSTFEL
jgi:hypothetical protein